MIARSRWSRTLALIAAVLAAAVVPATATADTAVPSEPRASDFSPAAAGDRVQRSGTLSHDLTGDGIPDLLARQPDLNNGSMWVYPSRGKLQGLSTLGARTLVATGWNIYNWVGTAEITGDNEEYETVPEPPADVLVRRASDGALLVYPHSGKLNGTSTLAATPIVVGRSGWNAMYSIRLADVTTDGFDDIVAIDNQDKMWVYPHSGTFDGLNTFKARVQVRTGRPLWDMNTNWSRENPDMIAASIATGRLTACKHTNTFDGLNTFATDAANCPDLAPAGTFGGDTTTWISLIDANGDGRDDVLKRTTSGALMLYPFRGWTANAALGTPVQIGSSGWNAMDLIT
ncbi:hypothetical protein ACIOD2_46680 [Amycolatopsis sp. NPDC088138]|uniref:hypothetical protein n=1 Tax=Amycolatopsis sp. NPDC088138 TaxID=3363938 RepID=UPI003802F25C